MKWITRERAKVDRVACPWLISRFLDPTPEFIYVPADRVLAEAEMQGATPYDVAGVELGHQGPCYSFDALLRKYGLDAIAGGFQLMEISDHEKLKWEFPLYDALCVYCGGTWPIPKPTEGI
jgi:hypothetical protein